MVPIERANDTPLRARLDETMDSLLADTDIEEAYSSAYVHAVAAGAGYVIALRHFDRDGVDITIEGGADLRPKIDIQLKATINLPIVGSVFKYPCRQKNFDLLRIQTQVPRILVVLHLPKEKERWFGTDETSLSIRNCAYWVCLTGQPENTNKTNTTIDIPINNVFNVENLRILMDLSRTGTLK